MNKLLTPKVHTIDDGSWSMHKVESSKANKKYNQVHNLNPKIMTSCGTNLNNKSFFHVISSARSFDINRERVLLVTAQIGVAHEV